MFDRPSASQYSVNAQTALELVLGDRHVGHIATPMRDRRGDGKVIVPRGMVLVNTIVDQLELQGGWAVDCMWDHDDAANPTEHACKSYGGVLVRCTGIERNANINVMVHSGYHPNDPWAEASAGRPITRCVDSLMIGGEDQWFIDDTRLELLRCVGHSGWIGDDPDTLEDAHSDVIQVDGPGAELEAIDSALLQRYGQQNAAVQFNEGVQGKTELERCLIGGGRTTLNGNNALVAEPEASATDCTFVEDTFTIEQVRSSQDIWTVVNSDEIPRDAIPGY